LLQSINFEYAGGDSPHHSIDRLTTTDSEIFYSSDDGNGRIFHKAQEYGSKIISSTIVAAALRDGDSLSKKPYLFAEMIDYMLGITTVTSLREAFGGFDSPESPEVFPNPAFDHVNISFNLLQNANASMKILDYAGRIVYNTNLNYLKAGENKITWNLKNASGVKVKPGKYFYHLKTDDNILSGKIIVIR
jgi:hypothetical protein